MTRAVLACLLLLGLVASVTPIPTCGNGPTHDTGLTQHGAGRSDDCGAAPNLLSCAGGHCPAIVHPPGGLAPEPAGHRVIEWAPLAPEILSLPPESPPPEA